MQAGRGTDPEARGRDLGSAAEEWVEVEADRDQAQAEEERELEAPEEALVRVRQEVCGKAARAEDRVPAQVSEAGREAKGLVPAEVGERVAVRVEVARVAEEERVQALAEGAQAQQVAQDLAAGALLAQELEEVERDRAERERQEDG